MARAGKRKFQPFKFKVDGQAVEVPTWAETDEAGRVTFITLDDQTGEEMRNADVNALRKTVEAAVKARLALDWRLMLKVVVWSGRGNDGAKLQIDLSCYRVAEAADGSKFSERVPEPWLAEEPWDGTWKPGHFSGSRIGADFPRTGEETWGGETKMVALVPASVVNVEAARSLRRRLAKLSDEVLRLFSPERAQATLSGIAAKTMGLYLTAPAEESAAGSRP